MSTSTDQLTRLADLLERGHISQTEFDAEKKRILGGAAPLGSPEFDADDGEVMPESGIVMAILVTLFCFLPFGVVAIVKASQVNALWLADQRDQARLAADQARTWSFAAIVTGLLFGVIYAALANS